MTIGKHGVTVDTTFVYHLYAKVLTIPVSELGPDLWRDHQKLYDCVKLSFLAVAIPKI